MEKPSPKTTEVNMLAWGKRIELLPNRDGAIESQILALRASRFEGVKNIEDLRLPTNWRIRLPLGEFLKDPQNNLPKNQQCKWFVLLEPKKNTLPRHRKIQLRVEEITAFVLKTIEDNRLSPEDYELAMAENYPQLYGGNILVDHDGNVLAEFCKGGQGVIAEGTYDSTKHGTLFSVESDPYTHVLRYSWEDGEASDFMPLRSAFLHTLSQIPHEEEGVFTKYKEGYYEFHLIKKSDQGPLEPNFVDCRTDPILTVL